MEIEEALEILKRLKKSPGRKYSAKYIEDTRNTLDNLRKSIQKTKGTKGELDSQNFEKIAAAIEKFLVEKDSVSVSSDIDSITTAKTEENSLITEENNIVTTENIIEQEENNLSGNMTTFNIETALKAIPTFNGQHKELEPFLKITEILFNTYDQASKTLLIEFVKSVKLSPNVRTTIGYTNNITDFNQLRNKLTESYKNKITTAQIHTRLANITQRNLPTTSYKDKILNLITELNNLQINELGTNATTDQKSVVNQMNDNYALTIFKNGLNENLKSTIFAAQPKTFTEATNLALEYENTEHSSPRSIMNVNRNSNQRRFVQRNNFNNQRWNNGNRNNSNYNRNNYNRNQFPNNNNNLRQNINNGYRNNNNNRNNNDNSRWYNNRYPPHQNHGSNSNRNNRYNNRQVRVIHDQGNENGPEDTELPEGHQ